MHDERTVKNRRFWRRMSYTTKVTGAFVAVAAMTALVAFGVLTFVWEQHFQTYTRENIQRIADTTAELVGERYAQQGEWYGGALSAAQSVHELTHGVGVQVTDAAGNVIYDDSHVVDGQQRSSLAPTARESSARADIVSNGMVVGSVRVWVYGSNTLLTQADQEFRQQSYQAMVFSSALAVALALVLGVAFARGLVQPINRVTRAARRFGEGDLTARTEMHGDDEIAQLGVTFDTMAARVEKDRQLERRLTTDVAHELRTPLMAIQSTVEAMVDGVFEPNQERLTTVTEEVQRLSRLVDAILRLSRLENRTETPDMEITNLSDLITGIISTHEAFVTDSGLELVYRPTPDVYVLCNHDMIRQATSNLISNAVRYTPSPGTVTVTVSTGEQMASIAVADTGIGLTEEEAKMVFSRFWRADAGRNRAQGGLGVGLSLVKAIVDAHDGWVRVEGEPDHGATFTIYLPLYTEERHKAMRERRRRSQAEAEARASS